MRRGRRGAPAGDDRGHDPDILVEMENEAGEVIGARAHVAVADQHDVVAARIVGANEVVDLGVHSDAEIADHQARLAAGMLAHQRARRAERRDQPPRPRRRAARTRDNREERKIRGFRGDRCSTPLSGLSMETGGAGSGPGGSGSGLNRLRAQKVPKSVRDIARNQTPNVSQRIIA